ncbi:HDOD domain-containing protein [Marinomonas posidonica]|uniref:Signal transduction protein n=1 Tax=Marinomonas posidonica (strain CECT 7376 / NCIMB 14433 / IVIA-Po-181) TaxID=491952 RepID=F6D0F4_MARPP|nr:HDOD domain-containing protein [Marinomonas posidonica]AEF53676.1 putative signal transduction protein [Marinomonas posidonica IVIA-Po-181]
MKSSVNESQLGRILRGISIPPQPQVMVDLHMEQAMPYPDMERIANIIAQDVSISAAVLKLVNSNVFGLDQKIASIQQAVVLLGTDSVTNLVNGLAVKSELSDDTIQSLHSFWDTATDVAAISSSLANQLNFKYQDECYALGLFHNAGMPLMMKRFENYQKVIEKAYQSIEFALTDVENKTFKTNHSVIGYYLAKSWGLSKSCCMVIAEHHRVDILFRNRLPDNQLHLSFAAILKMAEHIASAYQHIGGANEDHEWNSIKHHALDHFELTEYDFDGLVEVCHEQGLGLN